ncbi:hypothetical protein BGZ99_003138 [Dissophora globulifera]|uniref:Galactose oxidase n=1 Tax=Dissophora globulifera TaxID=979702 RepID=A0A9P6RQB5_9FUNG|nr:hypothetical protein BGZ99_003138 [Dissophora globulifera]
MRFTLLTLTALAACVSHTLADTTTVAPPPRGVSGHTAVVANNTVFIQGGLNKDGTVSTVSYAIILDATHSLANATWQDTTTIAGFTPRDFGIAVAGSDSVVTCGTQDGAGAAITCDQFSTYAYNLTKHNDALTTGGGNKFGMAVAVATKTGKSYITGGSDGTNFLNTMYVMDTLNITSAPSWTAGTVMPTALKSHAATWVGGSVNGIVVVGGMVSATLPFTMNSAYIYNGTWSTKSVDVAQMGSNFVRYGHTAVSDNNGNIYLFGGFNAASGVPLNDHYVLNTNNPTWAWQKFTDGPEARGFHSATLLPDGTILYMFGQTGADKSTASTTYFTYNTGSNAWSLTTNVPTITVTTRSPNIPPPPPPVTASPNANPSSSGNNPNAPNSSGSNGGSGSSSSSTTLKVPVIAGIAAGGVVLLFLIILLIILIRRRRNRRGAVRHYPSDPVSKKKEMKMAGPTFDDDEKAKNARAFMIQRPPSVYIEDDRDAESDLPHPHYKSQYYGDQPPSHSGRDSVAEYELRPTAFSRNNLNTLSTVSSVAERRRFVEEQQRQFLEGHENAYNSPPPFDPSSDYPPNSSRDERQSEYDDYHEETLEELAGARGSTATSTTAGPRYPRTNLPNRQGPRSQYEHPADDYFQ